MALMRGKLFAGALFAGLLLRASSIPGIIVIGGRPKKKKKRDKIDEIKEIEPVQVIPKQLHKPKIDESARRTKEIIRLINRQLEEDDEEAILFLI